MLLATAQRETEIRALIAPFLDPLWTKIKHLESGCNALQLSSNLNYNL